MSNLTRREKVVSRSQPNDGIECSSQASGTDNLIIKPATCRRAKRRWESSDAQDKEALCGLGNRREVLLAAACLRSGRARPEDLPPCVTAAGRHRRAGAADGAQASLTVACRRHKGNPDGGQGLTRAGHWIFVHDQFACGRGFRVLNIVDDVTRECLAAIADTSIPGRRVRELTELTGCRAKPGMTVSDHGTEFTSNAIQHATRKADLAMSVRANENHRDVIGIRTFPVR
jgi:transposase InsO family protein